MMTANDYIFREAGYGPRIQETAAARVTPFDEEVERYVRRVTRDMTRACVALTLATGFSALVKRSRLV